MAAPGRHPLLCVALLHCLSACGSVQDGDDGPGDDGSSDADGSTGSGSDAASADANTDAGGDLDAASLCGADNFVLTFDGQQFAAVPDSSFLHPAGDLTVEAWARFDGTTPGGYNSIVIKTVGDQTNDSYALWYQDGVLNGMVNLGFPDSVTATYPWSPELGQWYFLAFTFTLGDHTQRLYIDGEEVVTVVNVQTPTFDNHILTIGSDFGGGVASGLFLGRIDEVRLFDVARTRDQIVADAASCPTGPQPGLLAHWSFNEGRGQFVQDSTGNGNRGTLGPTDSVEPGDPVWLLSTDPFPAE